MTTAVGTLLVGGPTAGLAAPVLPPGVTLPPRASDTTTTTTTVAPLVTTTSPPTTGPPTSLPETKVVAVPVPKGETKILDDPPAGAAGASRSGAAAGAATSPTTTGPAAPPAPRLNEGQVQQILRTMERSGASSTAGLVEALRPLQKLGMTADEALALGMGRFPVQGPANWTDDWLDPRAGPPPHQHMGNDLFAAFDTPVRAPGDGVVRFANEGLGGLAAYVTTPDGTYYYMAHLSRFAAGLGGTAVKQGQVVGFNGDSGNAAGGAPHVHFEIHPGGGAAVNPKLILDGWVADALARVPALLASFEPAAPSAGSGEGVPQILVATGMTRRFSSAPRPAGAAALAKDRFNHAVLRPLTPPALGSLLDLSRTER